MDGWMDGWTEIKTRSADHIYLFLVHRFDYFAHVTALLLQQLNFLPEEAHFGVEFVPLRLQSAEILNFLRDDHLQLADFRLVVRRQSVGGFVRLGRGLAAEPLHAKLPAVALPLDEESASRWAGAQLFYQIVIVHIAFLPFSNLFKE